ncbi:sporulation/spore germination protein [Desulfosporosinus acidiphilus SJ4]|uniref:Sporulation/spore germination protein n=1 Tax=Desulfosporosinus acidiphilus (strain DSM 22704 / JCM 16185 / SJ4) TaxID=646529 RepID=I4DAL4_DESAJ|nr:GerMN domain-containing protein [Desulfosporosinus acidiphilus]AFM42838.1 sporulation/spore germination protein [Desulfosporosinus acidiphilus SJ4]
MTRGFHKLHIFALISLLLSVTLLAGCNSVKTQQTQPSNTSGNNTSSVSSTPSNNDTGTSTQPSQSVKLTLYFPNNDGSALVPVERTVQISNQEVINTMLKELSSPPSGLESPLPKGTILRSADVKNGIATLNFSKEFKQNFSGGSDAEMMTIYGIVDTLTSLSNVQSVQFLLEGQKQDVILGGLDTSGPLTRNNSLIKK